MSTPVSEGMVVRTNTPVLQEARKCVLELILSDHPMECSTCIRNLNCELQELANKMGLREPVVPENWLLLFAEWVLIEYLIPNLVLTLLLWKRQMNL